MTVGNDTSETVRTGFAKILNRHGYGFHYSVLKLAGDLCNRRESKWIFEVAEFPVQVQGETTRIDFILRLEHELPVYLLAECKRANPAISNWCFARAPYVRRNRTRREPFFVELAQQQPRDSDFYASVRMGLTLDDAYHIALEVKSDSKGDPCGPGRGEIERAVTQICRGLNGMVEFLSKDVQVLPNRTAYLLPVVFTTAHLWRSSVDLSSANLEDGSIDLGGTDFTQEPWIFYQCHLSPGLKHSYSPMQRPENIGDLMDSEYVRTVVIVSASGIESFLKWSSDPDYYLTW